VKREGKLSIRDGRFLIETQFFQPLGCSAKSSGQRTMFVGITQDAQQAPDLVPASPSSANDAQSAGGLDTPSLHLLEERAFEFAAVFGPVSVDPALAAVKSRARLRPSPGIVAQRADAPILTRCLPRARQGGKERFQARRVIAGLQLHIGKNHAVAAEPTGQAKLFRRRTL
jgi:hypothetical protein